MSCTEKLAQMDIDVTPFDSLDNGKFVQAVRTGSLVYTSGQISQWAGRDIKGKVGADVSPRDAYEAARFCGLNMLRAVLTLGVSLDDITRVVKLFGMVNVAPGYSDTASAVNGCSDLFRDIFGDIGLHARSAVGMTLPFDWAVEIEAVFEVR